MTLKDYFQLAIDQGGDAVSRALGHAEAELARNPGNLVALIYKGSLLTMVGEEVLSASKRRDYIGTGLRLMDSALAAQSALGADTLEMAYVQATTLAILPQEMGQDAAALRALREVGHAPGFDRLRPVERLRVHALLACVAQLFGHPHEAGNHFRQARAIDEELAIQTYSDWLDRSVPELDPSTDR